MNLKDKNISRKVSSAEKITAVVSDSVGNYEKHPFFIKKAVAAKALLLKVGLPKQLTKKMPA
jgi:hypothetical protein